MSGSVTRVGDFCTLGNFLKPFATMNLPKSPTFLGNFCKGAKIIQFSNEILFGQLLQTFGDFYLVTLLRDPFTFNNYHHYLLIMFFTSKVKLRKLTLFRRNFDATWHQINNNFIHENVFSQLENFSFVSSVTR